MAQTFDIRFARSAGLAALLEVPENAFRWKGGGLLRIDAHGISIGLKRGLLALSGKRTQRIPTENLRAVYREGDALRLEFQDGKTTRIVLPFWADDRETAAKIVRLLPTSHTVEIEHSTSSSKARTDWRVLLSLTFALVAMVAGGWVLNQRTMPVAVSPTTANGPAANELPLPVPAPDQSHLQVENSKPLASSAPWFEAPAIPLNPSRSGSPIPSVARPARNESDVFPASKVDTSDVTATPGSEPVAGTAGDRDTSSQTWLVRVSPDGIVPFTPGIPAYEVARRQLDLFRAESNTLRGHFQAARYAGNNQRFREISILWEKVSIRVGNSPDFEDPALRPLQEIELAVSRAWRRALKMLEDPALLVSADEEVEFAEMLEARAQQFLN